MSVRILSVVESGKESEFEWKIPNFALRTDRYLSKHFKFECHYWGFILFLKHTYPYMDLRLLRSTRGSPTEMEFSVALKTNKGTKSFERRGRMCFFGLLSFYDFDKWISRSEFINRRREFLSSGCLSILITMKKADSGESESEDGTIQSSMFSPKSKILQDLKQMFLSQEHCDVVLKVQGAEFSAHKNILAARSPVFACMFRSNMKETVTGIVDIEDMDPSCFPEFLSFLYCGESEKLSAENVRSLFAAADKYDIKDLRTICVRFMKKNLSVDAFCETLELSLLHSESGLIDACTDFFVKNAGKILETVQWQTFATEKPTHSNKLLAKYMNRTTRSNS